MQTYFSLAVSLCATLALILSAPLVAEQQNENRENGPQIMQQQLQMMEPELQERVQALSPQTKQALQRIMAQHTRHSESATFRQVMHEITADFHSATVGVLTANKEQAAEAALRIANHRIPVGGLLPYLSLDKINDQTLATLVSFNDAVEGNARKLAQHARAGEMSQAAKLLGDIASGCTACHEVFRGTPGTSPFLRDPE